MDPYEAKRPSINNDEEKHFIIDDEEKHFIIDDEEKPFINNDEEKPFIIAHRGYSARYPENTLVAFQAAMDAGADMIELDVSFSRDRQLVVIHDDILDRTTNGKGQVDGCDLEELKTLDAGGWFHPHFYGERIPTLEDVLDLVGGRSGINIEIKSSAYEADRPPDAIERQVVDLVLEDDLADTILISSFEWKLLENIRRINGEIRTALLSKESADPDSVAECRRLDAFSWHQNHKTLDEDQVALMHDAGIRVFVYTVNSQNRFRKLLKMGVDGVFTDDPLGFRQG